MARAGRTRGWPRLERRARPAGKRDGECALTAGGAHSARGSTPGPAPCTPAQGASILGPGSRPLCPAAPSPRRRPRSGSKPPQPGPVSCGKRAETGGRTRPAGHPSRVRPEAAPARPRQGPGARATVSGSRSAGLSRPCAELNLESGTCSCPPPPNVALYPLPFPRLTSPSSILFVL